MHPSYLVNEPRHLHKSLMHLRHSVYVERRQQVSGTRTGEAGEGVNRREKVPPQSGAMHSKQGRTRRFAGSVFVMVNEKFGSFTKISFPVC